MNARQMISTLRQARSFFDLQDKLTPFDLASGLQEIETRLERLELAAQAAAQAAKVAPPKA